MRHYSRDIVLLALLNTLLGATTASAESLDALLRVEIESLAAKLTDGFATFDGADAYWGANETSLADHVVVLFGLTSWGGGNGSRQSMAVMQRNGGFQGGWL